MTPYALRLCFFDPGRDEDGYGGERCTFVVCAEDLSSALIAWLDRAAARGVTLQLVEEAGLVQGKDLAELVSAAQEGGIAAGQSYAYPPLAPAKGVFFGLIREADGWTEVAAKAPDAAEATRSVLNTLAEEGRIATTLSGLCDLSQATDDVSFGGTALPMAALGLGMQATGTVQFGARYEESEDA